MAQRRTLVTGGAGFIGSHLVDALLSRGHSVIVLDDFSTGRHAHLAQHDGNPNLVVVEADIRDESVTSPWFRGVQDVFHLACRNVRLSLRQPTLVHEVNATGTFNVLKAAAAAHVERFLYCSSSEVNGTADLVPMPEEYHYKPETIYGASKLVGEYYTQVFQRAGWLATVIARPHNNYGPREHYEGITGEVIPRFILWGLADQPLMIYGDGRQTRDFTYVTETAQYLVRLAECPQGVGQTFNICRGQEVSILELAQQISNLLERETPLIHLPGRPSDVRRLIGDPTKLRQTLGDAPQVDISQGLRRTLEWFRRHRPPTPEVLASLLPENWQATVPEPWLPDGGHCSPRI